MINYWINRLEFGIGYLDTIEAVSKAATAERAADEAKEQGDAQRALEHSAHAIAQAQVAVCRARVATQTFARAAKNRSDHGAVAILNQFVYLPLKRRLDELRERG